MRETTASWAGASSITRLSKLTANGSRAMSRATNTATKRRVILSVSRKVITQTAVPSTAST